MKTQITLTYIFVALPTSILLDLDLCVMCMHWSCVPLFVSIINSLPLSFYVCVVWAGRCESDSSGLNNSQLSPVEWTPLLNGALSLRHSAGLDLEPGNPTVPVHQYDELSWG